MPTVAEIGKAWFSTPTDFLALNGMEIARTTTNGCHLKSIRSKREIYEAEISSPFQHQLPGQQQGQHHRAEKKRPYSVEDRYCRKDRIPKS